MESEPKAEKKPVYVAKSGNVKIPVQTYGDSRFIIRWYQHEGAPRSRETFTKKSEATARADEIASAIANSQADVLTLTSADRDNYRLAVQALRPWGIPLNVAIAEYVSALERVGKHSLGAAVQFFVRGHVERKECPTTDKVLERLLIELRDDRRDEGKYIEPLDRDLEAFAKVHLDLPAVTEENVRDYLNGLRTSRAWRQKDGTIKPAGSPVSARRRDNVRESIVRLMRFAKKKEWLDPQRITVAELIPKQSEGGEVTTYSPGQISTILHYFATQDPVWLPWAAIACFGGLRTSEIFRLEWMAFRWREKTIAVRRAVARKVRVARQVPILDPLDEWLRLCAEESGFVIPRKWKDLESAQTDALARMRKALKWEGWDNNALRHSFGSNRLAIVKNIAQVALEMGNSPAKVREDYNDPKSEIEAKQYFEVYPSDELKKIVKFGTKLAR